ncbi:MAG: efflux RND transporter periplasmic adaptor subunit [Syntrophus sp. (in: bacteria)]|nr:efflux RND transporter periplasmic adaptor subunit [Syntrophus sp. (in: bacteria)]
MKKKNLIIIGGVIILAALVIYLVRGGLRNRLPNGESPQVTTSQTSSPQEEPGGTPVTSPEKPGATESAQKEEAPTIEIPLEKQQLIGVRTTAASLQPLQKAIRTVGKIEYDERMLFTVNTKVEGWIEKLYISFTGQYVKKGEPLANIYSPELWATQQEFINLVRWTKRTGKRSQDNGATGVAGQGDESRNLASMLSKDAETMVGAARQRLKLWDISDEQIRRIEESEKPLRTLTVYSPASGYVLQKYAVQGMKVMAGEKLLDLSDLSTVWVTSDVYENDLSLIKVGETARIKLSYFPGREFSARIDFVAPSLSADTRTAKIRFSIPNPGGQLKPQMFTDVELKINLGSRLAVPDEAVIDTGLRQIVYVDKGNGYFEPRVVTTGLRAEKAVEILSGLKAGEKIASSANFLIDSEAKLKGVEARSATPAAKPGTVPSAGKQQAPAPPHRH